MMTHRRVRILSYSTQKFCFVSFKMNYVRRSGNHGSYRGRQPFSFLYFPSSNLRSDFCNLCSWEIQALPFLLCQPVMEKGAPCSPPYADFTALLPHCQISLTEISTSGGKEQGTTQGTPQAADSTAGLAQHLSRAGRHRAWPHTPKAKVVPVLKG